MQDIKQIIEGMDRLTASIEYLAKQTERSLDVYEAQVRQCERLQAEQQAQYEQQLQQMRESMMPHVTGS